MSVTYLAEEIKVLIDDSEVGQICVDNDNGCYYEDLAGNIYTPDELRDIANKIEGKEVT